MLSKEQWIVVMGVMMYMIDHPDTFRDCSDGMYGETDPNITNDEFAECLGQSVFAIATFAGLLANTLPNTVV